MGFFTLERTWRRTLAFTLLAFMASTSDVATVASIGSTAKMAAFGLLVFVTFYSTRSQSGRFSGASHRFLIASLWVMTGFALASLVWSGSKLETLTDGVALGLLVYILHRVSTTRWRERAILIDDFNSIYWALMIALIVGMGLIFSGFSAAIGGSDRPQGVFGNPNMLGIVAVMALTIGIGLAIEKRQLLLWVSLLVPTLNILLSQSRTAIIAAIICLVWVMLRHNILWIAVVGLGAAILITTIHAFRIGIEGGVIDRFTMADSDDLLNSRTDVWQEVFWNLQENPLGVGWAATRVTMEQLYLEGSTDSGLFSVHNAWLQILNEFGWAGLIPVVLLLIATLRIAFGANVSGIGSSLVAATVAGSMINLTESVMVAMGHPYPYLFWTVVVAAAVNSAPHQLEPFVEIPNERVKTTLNQSLLS